MQGNLIYFGPFAFDRERMSLSRGGQPIGLNGRGAALLAALLEAGGAIVRKEALMEAAWPGTLVEEGNLSVQVTALRRALGERPDGEEWIATVPRIGYRLLHSPDESEESRLKRRPSIAVLPFLNLNSDPEQGHFADGVVEDLITALSRFKTFAVVSRNSSFVYQNRAVDARTVASELGVRYMLEGSVRRSGERVRVTAQLIEGASGGHLWAEKFEGAPGDIFDFQDEITRSVIGLIEPQIRKAEIERSRRKRPESLDVWDLYNQALPLVYSPDTTGYAEAIALLERAIALDPGYAPALALASWVHEKRVSLGGMVPPGVDDIALSLAYAEQALKADEDDPVVLALAGWIRIKFTEDASALALCERAMTLNPNNLLVLNYAAVGHMAAGDLDTMIACATQALHLSPGAPDNYISLHDIGNGHFASGRYEQAVTWQQRSISVNPGYFFSHLALAAAYAHLGRLAEARAEVDAALALRPGMTLASISKHRVYRFPERRRRWVDGLLKVGLPER